jgi:hypothetical protein
MVQLLEAERARLAGDVRRARVLYEKAAQRAAQQEFPPQAALAHERLGQMYLDLLRHVKAASALHQAVALYAAWGCPAKVARLRPQFDERNGGPEQGQCPTRNLRGPTPRPQRRRRTKAFLTFRHRSQSAGAGTWDEDVHQLRHFGFRGVPLFRGVPRRHRTGSAHVGL